MKEVLGQKIGSSSGDLLNEMEKTAISVLEEANLPTETHTQVTTTNNRTVTESKSPMVIAENKYGKFSDEYHAASVLFWIMVCRQDIKKDKAESAVYATLQTTYHFHQLITDQRAYAIGLHATHDPKFQDQITRDKEKGSC